MDAAELRSWPSPGREVGTHRRRRGGSTILNALLKVSHGGEESMILEAWLLLGCRTGATMVGNFPRVSSGGG